MGFILVEDDGSIDLWFNSKHHSKSSYPIAQLIRLKVILAKLDGVNLDENTQKLKYTEPYQVIQIAATIMQHS